MPDLRAPEDRLSREGGIARSRAVDEWIENYLTAEVDGDDYGRRSALKGVIDANRADHAAAGVPVYAHPPLPKDFVDGLLNAIAVLPPPFQARAVGDFLGTVDPASRPMAGQQLAAQKSDRPKTPAPRSDPDPDSPESRRRAEDMKKQSWLARILYPIAYAGDAAAEDWFGEDGIVGDWGHRRTLPPPTDPVPRFIAEALRIYLGLGPAGVGKWGRAGRAARGARGATAPRGGPRTTTSAARAHVCNMSCHCYQIPGSDAKCPPFVYGVGKGSNAAQAYRIAKTVAGAQVPKGCGYRHCQCRP
jgi:hypothetical protein